MIGEIFKADAETRPAELLRHHYETEKALAGRLRSASREQRRALYSQLYDELFRTVPHHPQIARDVDEASSAREVNRKMALVGRHIDPRTVLLEVGPGDCHFSFAAAQRVKQVIAVDVSAEIAARRAAPSNFQLILSDGCTIPVDAGSVTVIYSNQLMEHLHPDDAREQLRNLYRALAPGGLYVCITPNRLSGPHDVSQHFDAVATGFHLKEYSYGELSRMFGEVGFVNLRAYFGGRGVYLRFPLTLIRLAEEILDRLPLRLRALLGRSFPGRALLGINLIASKPR